MYEPVPAPRSSAWGMSDGPGVAGIVVFPLAWVSTGWAHGYDWMPAEK
ncbi:hypothetical protein [Streptomyces sp. NPDC058595]